jgi:hypothetical protein
VLDGRPPTADDLLRLVYLRQVIDEVGRLRSRRRSPGAAEGADLAASASHGADPDALAPWVSR